MPLVEEAPARAADEAGRYRYGCYRQPIADLGYHPSWWQRMRLKHWHYVSLVSADWFLGVAVAQLYYIANVFCYLVDRRDGRKVEYARLLPGGVGVRMAPSSTSGASLYRKGRDRIELTPHGGTISLPWLDGSFEVTHDDAVALLHPLAENRPAYTHKEAGNVARGRFRWGDRDVSFDTAYATLDWTCSFANRRTVWKWLSVGARATTGERVGINLSAEVYDDAENYCWIDGRAHPLGAARFQTQDAWRAEGEGFELRFEPQGDRRENVQLGIIASRFVQKFGRLEGTLHVDGRTLTLRDAYGVMEDHQALW